MLKSVKIYMCASLIGLTLLSGCKKKESELTANGEAHGVPGLVNPGFESGKLEPWVAYGDVKASVDRGVAAHSGQFGLTEAGTNGSVWQDVSGLEAGKLYTISAWVSANPGGNTIARFAIFNPTTSEVAFSEESRPGTNWQQIKYSFRLTKGETIKFHLWRHPGPGTVYWDDIQLSKE